MNDDNDAARRMVEQCYRTRKTMVNPIVDWTDEDVWDFLNGNGIQHCCLYDEGFKRLGCIGCPLSGSKNMIRDFERWPKYKELYIKAFQRMIDRHPGQIKILDPNCYTKFKLEEIDGGGYTSAGTGSTKAIDEAPGDNGEEFIRGGYGSSTTGWTSRVMSDFLFHDWIGNGGQWSPWIKSRIGSGSFHALGRSRRNMKQSPSPGAHVPSGDGFGV